MDYWLGPVFASSFKEYSEFEDHWFDLLGQCTLTLLRFEEFAGQVLEDQICGDALCQELVELGSDLAQVLWALLSNDVACNLTDEALVVWSWHLRLARQVRVS